MSKALGQPVAKLFLSFLSPGMDEPQQSQTQYVPVENGFIESF